MMLHTRCLTQCGWYSWDMSLDLVSLSISAYHIHAIIVRFKESFISLNVGVQYINGML